MHCNKIILRWSSMAAKTFAQHFYRAMLCIAVLAMALCPSVRLSVRQSVRLSVTSRCSTKTAKRRITQTTPHDSPGTLVS